MRKPVLGALAAALVVIGAAGLALAGRWRWHRLDPVVPPPPIVPVLRSTTDTLRPGEALGALFGRHGIEPVEYGRVVDLLGLDPRRIRAGQVFHFARLPDDSAAALVVVRRSPTEEVRVARAAETWVAEVREIDWSSRPVRMEGRIETSLYDGLAGALADEPISSGDRVRLAWDLADVFAWQVDFSRDLQPGDAFVVVFERQRSELGESRLGRVLASTLEVGGRAMSAFRFDEPDGHSEFFDDQGESLRRAFLRAPVEFRRISSGFSRSRRHPILGISRRHQGVDYAANSGTPVMAASDGQVKSAGWAGGYGRMVEIRHKNGITTRYAHLRGFARGIRSGVRVLQGDIVGYVGSTGVATGAHLHYEFRRNGVAVDPRRIDPGNGDPVPASLRAAFDTVRTRLNLLLHPLAPAPAPVAEATVAGGS